MRMSRHPLLRAALVHAALVTLVAVFALPLWGMVATALKSEAQVQDVSSLSRILVPDPVKWDNFAQVFRRSAFPRYFANSLLLVLFNVAGVAVVCPLVAYGFSRFDWPGREAVFFLLLSTMMLPPQVTFIPVFLIFRALGWYNTMKPLWFPFFFGSAFFIFLLRQFFRTLPTDLEDAAHIDGCGHFRTFIEIMLPLVKPALEAVAVIQFMNSWNDFLGPLIYINDDRFTTLSMGVYYYKLERQGMWGEMMAVTLMMTLPAIVVFFCAQKHFVQGITLTGMKE